MGQDGAEKVACPDCGDTGLLYLLGDYSGTLIARPCDCGCDVTGASARAEVSMLDRVLLAQTAMTVALCYALLTLAGALQ